MTWPLASFVLLLCALAAGAAWWERGRPSSRMLAIVAALAALAALGRLAFAPLPNVKPTTDIVLLSGYVLGGAPGFVVGAVGALASNVVFGQGPWTPWQMAAWGAVGVLGAALGAATGRRLGRVPLAAACGVAGLLFGAIMDLSTWTTLSGSHTVDAYLTIAGISLPFNLAHAAGNVGFALVFAPVLVSALQRSARRSHVTWRPAGAAVVGALAVATVLVAGPEPAAAGSRSADRAVSYLRSAQNRDGGFGAARGQASSPLYAAWAAVGIASAGERCGAPLTRYLQRTGASVRGVGDVERTILALRACGASTTAGRRDLLADLRRAQRRDGSWSGLVNQTAFGVLALRAAGTPRSAGSLARAVRYLTALQHRDGGFAFAGRSGRSDVDVTAAVLQALVAVRGRDAGAAGRRAVSFLRRAQRADGGFPLSPGQGSNAQSTAFAIQGLVAAGVRPGSIRRDGSRTATGYIESLMTRDGAVRYSRTSAQTPVWVTAQAVPALAGRSLPVV
jgi:squalene-hopene cyclase-like protein/prenyltransferase/squalene oxidase-like repeat protein